jgi:glutathione synthase/RimK-type ligase-like ATP-grasp enzyme
MSDIARDEVWVIDRFDAYWEDLEVVGNLQGRGITARYVDWNQVRFETGAIRISGEPVAPPSLGYIRSRVLTQAEPGALAETYDQLEMLEDAGTALINPLSAIRACQNKLRQARILRAGGVHVPHTRAVSSSTDILGCLKDWGTIILKPIHGHGSIDLVRLRPPIRTAAGSGLDPIEEIRAWHLLRRHKTLCAQDYIPNTGRDLRVSVIDNDIVSCYWRQLTINAMDYHLEVEPAKVTSEITGIIKRCVEELNLGIGTIDLVENDTGLTVIEVNASLSAWEHIEGKPELDFSNDGITDRHGEYIQRLSTASSARG